MPWLWSLRVLKTLSPYTVAIAVTLEPVYSIFLSFILWPREERLTPRFYAGTALLITLIVAFPSAVQLWCILVSLFVSGIVGLFFGVYPAHKAAQLDPIVALRAEL